MSICQPLRCENKYLALPALVVHVRNVEPGDLCDNHPAGAGCVRVAATVAR